MAGPCTVKPSARLMELEQCLEGRLPAGYHVRVSTVLLALGESSYNAPVLRVEKPRRGLARLMGPYVAAVLSPGYLDREESGSLEITVNADDVHVAIGPVVRLAADSGYAIVYKGEHLHADYRVILTAVTPKYDVRVEETGRTVYVLPKAETTPQP